MPELVKVLWDIPHGMDPLVPGESPSRQTGRLRCVPLFRRRRPREAARSCLGPLQLFAEASNVFGRCVMFEARDTTAGRAFDRRFASSSHEDDGTRTKCALPEAESHREILDAWSEPNNQNNAAVLQDCLQHDLTHNGKSLRATPQRNGAPHRPATFSPELAKRICELVAGSTMSLQQIALQLGIGSAGVIQVWRQRHADFAEITRVRARCRWSCGPTSCSRSPTTAATTRWKPKRRLAR
jgi:transposase-like protein